jgi:hypothetical protein
MRELKDSAEAKEAAKNLEARAGAAKSIPRRLKPGISCFTFGTTEVVPFQGEEFSASCEAELFQNIPYQCVF